MGPAATMPASPASAFEREPAELRARRLAAARRRATALLAGITVVFAAVTVAGAQGSQSIPAQQPGNDADDYCAICATIHLAANSFVPQAPQLPVPFVSQTIEHADRAAVAFIAPRRPPFQSRAPPLV